MNYFLVRMLNGCCYHMYFTVKKKCNFSPPLQQQPYIVPYSFIVLLGLNWSISILVATLSNTVFQYVFAFISDSVHVRVTFQVPPQVVQTGVGLGTDLAVVRSHP